MLRSGIMCLPESSIKVITFSSMNYFKIHVTPIYKVLSPNAVGKQYAKYFMTVKEA